MSFRALLLLCLLSIAAHAQTNPNFQQGSILGATPLNNSFAIKGDAANGVFTNPTITGGTQTGTNVTNPTITGGTQTGTNVSGSNVTATGGTTARTPAARAADVVNVKDFGATGNAVNLVDGTISASGTTLTSASANFTAADVGKYVMLMGAGTSGVLQEGTITGFTNSHTVTVSFTAANATPWSEAVNAIPATTQSGSGSYAPGNTITISGGTGVIAAPVFTIFATQAVAATVNAVGSGGSTGACTVTGTSTAYPAFQATGTVSGGALVAGALTVTVPGYYIANPSSLSAEPVTGCGLTGATITLKMGVKIVTSSTAGQETTLPANPVSTTTNGPGTGATLTLFPTQVGGFLTYGTNDTTAITAATAAIPSQGGELLFPNGNYLISNFFTLASNTDVSGLGATITAAGATAWGGTVSAAFNIPSAASNVTITGLGFTYPEGIPYNGAHIITVNGGSHVIVQNNQADGGGDLVANVGGNDVQILGNKYTNSSNACYDNWNGFTDAKIIGNYCTSYPPSGSGVGMIQCTGITTAAGPATSSGCQIIGNSVLLTHATNPQGIIINGYGTCSAAATDDKFIVANNKIVVQYQNAWGILVTGCANNGDIHDNYLEGSNQGNSSAVGVFAPGTNIQVHNNIAVNWNGGAGGEFANTAPGGTIVDNEAYGSTSPLLGTSDTTTRITGNDTGTGSPIQYGANIQSGSAAFTTGFSSVASGTFGWNGAGGIWINLNAAAGTSKYILGETAGVARWYLVPGNNTAEGGSNAGSDFQLDAQSDAGASLSSPFTIQRSSGHIILSSTAGIAVSSGTSDCGTTPAIAGSDNNGRVTVGSSTNGGHCTVTFAKSWTNAPTCSVWNETSGARGVFPVSGTSTLVITAASTISAADKLGYSCVGY